ncbi:hypothetical protein [uncultured Bacteroides sp.]|nr:hypothetical protein [uncultured Bacteroides sp.]
MTNRHFLTTNETGTLFAKQKVNSGSETKGRSNPGKPKPPAPPPSA